MTAKDLMIGDYVLACGKKTQVVWIGNIKKLAVRGFPSEFFEDEVEPIPLTPEILEKNGWMYNNEDEKFFPQTWVGGGLMLQGADDCGYRIVVTSDYDDEDTNNTPFILLYVHELQQALRLRRIKKEIIL